MPIDYANYPAEWFTEIRPAILERAQHRCEFCGAENYKPHPVTGSRVVLTIAHLDHDTMNNDHSNLRALCQKCHNQYDRDRRGRHRAETLDKKQGQLRLGFDD